ncbi:MAG TPA: LysR family transcriptional regulator [Caulobacteraceae bacterium]|nr:LysR family transcriptional regulator [Caulobacteraceae bacterium]
MHSQTLDLNLLKVFDALLEERSVTRAGARLGLTQSAVSHALNRLRYSLGDDLFLRDSRGMTPTPRAMEIGPRLRAALDALQAAVTPVTFDPATSDRSFSVVAGAYACAVLVPSLVSRMSETAPRTRLEIGEVTPSLVDDVDSGRVDFVIAGFESVPDRFVQELLLAEQLAWIVRTGHPLTEGPVSLADLLRTPHVLVASRRPPFIQSPGRGALVMRSTYEDRGAFESEVAKRGLERRIGVSVPDTYAALAIVARSDMAALIPRRLALLSAQGGRLQLIDPPYESPAVEITLLYRRDRLEDPAIAWMRELMLEVAKEL